MQVFLLVATIYCILEGAWLFFMNSFYTGAFARFAKFPLSVYDFVAAAFSYVVLIFGFWYFVARHVASFKNAVDAFLNGAIFGLAVYGVYNMTNRATLKGYSWTLAIVDTTWGCLIGGVVAASLKLLMV